MDNIVTKPNNKTDSEIIEYKPLGRVTTAHNNPDVVTTAEYPYHNLVKVHKGYMRGVLIGDYHARVARGELLPHTPFTKFTVDSVGNYPPLTIKSFRTSDGFNFSTQADECHHGYTSHALMSVSESDLSQEATLDLGRFVQGAAARVNNKGADASTFVAELTDLKRTWTGLLDDIFRVNKRVLRKVRRDVISNPQRVIRYLSDAYLELRYGWRPLMYDIAEFENAIRRFDKNRTRWSERVGTTIRESVIYTDALDLSYSGEVYTNNISDEIEVSYRGNITVDVMPEQFRSDMGVTTWEKIPYSFVADWFLTVGQALSAQNLLLKASNYSASGGYKVTLTRQQRTDLAIVPYSPTEYKELWGGGFNPVATTVAVLERRIPTKVSISPFWTFNVDDWKAADAASLVLGIFNGNKNLKYY